MSETTQYIVCRPTSPHMEAEIFSRLGRSYKLYTLLPQPPCTKISSHITVIYQSQINV